MLYNLLRLYKENGFRKIVMKMGTKFSVKNIYPIMNLIKYKIKLF